MNDILFFLLEREWKVIQSLPFKDQYFSPKSIEIILVTRNSPKG
jgi:hypothetical protein